MARTTSLTPEVHKHIVRLVRSGVPFSTACDAAGVACSTGKLWRANGNKPDAVEPYLSFSADYARARAYAERQRLKVIKMAASTGDWRAAAWLLERSNPNRYGETKRTELSGRKGKPIEVQQTGVVVLPPLDDD
jgi:hypothetical protein